MSDIEAVTALAEPSPVSDTIIEGTPTPPAPEPSGETTESVPRSRREALEKAFDAVDGGNDSPPAEGGERARGPDGKFVAKEAQNAPEAEPKADAQPKTPEGKGPVTEAPSRFSADAKQVWADAPEAVRGEIKRAISELEGGLAQKDAQLEPLKPYMDMAQKQGTTVHEALDRFLKMEDALRSDLPKGMEMLAQNFGMTLPQLVAAAQRQQPPEQDAKDRQIADLTQQVRQLSTQVGDVSKTFEQNQHDATLKTVEAFADEHPRFDELSEHIAHALKTGFATSLQEAYDFADRLNPAPQPAVQQPSAQPAQTRPVRSVTGAPNAGSNPAREKPSTTRTEAIERAMSRAGF